MFDDFNIDDWQALFDENVKKRRMLADAIVQLASIQAANGVPPILELRHLAQQIGLKEGFLALIAVNSSEFYRNFEIPKRRGGVRTIDVPSPVLLDIQRWINRHILSVVEIHESAHGFVKKKSIITNARLHTDPGEMLKLDIKDFFPSISIRRVMAVFRRFGYSRRVSYNLSKFCTLNGRLPQGAATSPALSNIICKSLDRRMAAYATLAGLRYSRYADDVTISGPEISSAAWRAFESMIVDEGFTINTGKTKHLSLKARKIVAGVSVSSGACKLPRATVRQIKQEAHFILKRGILEHQQATQQFDPLMIERLMGKIGFWLQIDPNNKQANKISELLTLYKTNQDF